MSTEEPEGDDTRLEEYDYGLEYEVEQPERAVLDGSGAEEGYEAEAEEASREASPSSLVSHESSLDGDKVDSPLPRHDPTDDSDSDLEVTAVSSLSQNRPNPAPQADLDDIPIQPHTLTLSESSEDPVAIQAAVEQSGLPTPPMSPIPAERFPEPDLSRLREPEEQQLPPQLEQEKPGLAELADLVQQPIEPPSPRVELPPNTHIEESALHRFMERLLPDGSHPITPITLQGSSAPISSGPPFDADAISNPNMIDLLQQPSHGSALGERNQLKQTDDVAAEVLNAAKKTVAEFSPLPPAKGDGRLAEAAAGPVEPEHSQSVPSFSATDMFPADQFMSLKSPPQPFLDEESNLIVDNTSFPPATADDGQQWTLEADDALIQKIDKVQAGEHAPQWSALEDILGSCEPVDVASGLSSQQDMQMDEAFKQSEDINPIQSQEAENLPIYEDPTLLPPSITADQHETVSVSQSEDSRPVNIGSPTAREPTAILDTPQGEIVGWPSPSDDLFDRIAAVTSSQLRPDAKHDHSVSLPKEIEEEQRDSGQANKPSPEPLPEHGATPLVSEATPQDDVQTNSEPGEIPQTETDASKSLPKGSAEGEVGLLPL